MDYYFGIDFGTTNSALVCRRPLGTGKMSTVLLGDDNDRPIPSTVAIDEAGNVTVGREAWTNKMRLKNTCKYFHSIKTILDSDREYHIADKIWTPVKIASEVFKHLRALVREKLGTEMTEAFVSIPIGFSAQKRVKLRQAASMAGIAIKSFVNEPTAAFVANYDELKSASTAAIFDWGGGTLDVSIIEHNNGKIFELATDGMNIAGDQLDRKLAEKIHDKLSIKKNRNVAFDEMSPSDQDVMLVRAEAAKINFANNDEVPIAINKYGEYGSCREILSYDWFALTVEPEISRALDCLERAIKNSGAGLANIDRIVLVGGSSNLRPLIERMRQIYGDKLFFPDDMMWNVGMGAARLSVDAGEYYSNQSIGVVLSDASYYELLRRGDRIKDWRGECTFGVIDTTEEARFVFGCREGLDDAKVSTEDYMTLSVPNYKFLQEKIKLSAAIDEDLIFKATAASDMRSQKYARTWEYERLKCYYQLPR